MLKHCLTGREKAGKIKIDKYEDLYSSTNSFMVVSKFFLATQ